MSETRGAAPVGEKQRHIILDALRGFALLGICLANFPEFSLYSFLHSEAAEAMPTAVADRLTKFLIYFIVDGKFYTIFSLLFGIGFSIIIANAAQRGANGFRIFYRRMFFLLLIGFAHLMLIWSGDILMLYALVGMLLPLFMRLTDRWLLRAAGFFLLLPVIVDSVCQLAELHPSAAIIDWQAYYCNRYGITDANFAYWLRDAQSYDDVFKFLIQGAIVRLQEFVDGNRYFKVMGLFLIGYYIGRHRLYADIAAHKKQLRAIMRYGLLCGLPLSAVYAWSCVEGHPFGLGMHSLLYFASVYITSFGYVAVICLVYLRLKDAAMWRFLAMPGRMALTNYIGQSVAGMIIFYGIGFGLGADMGLIYVEFIAIAVFVCEALVSRLWLSAFRFGPLEWLWRCLTYGRHFPLIKKAENQ